MKNKTTSKVSRATYIWVYYKGNTEYKMPIFLMESAHILNTHKYLVSRRIRYKSYIRDCKKTESLEGLDNSVAKATEYIDWCNKWIPRFESEIKERKLKQLPPDINFINGLGKTFDIRYQLKADEKYIKANGPSTI